MWPREKIKYFSIMNSDNILEVNQTTSPSNDRVTFPSVSSIKVFSFTGIKLFLLVGLAFGLMNIIFLSINILRSGETSQKYIMAVILSIFIGSICILYAFYRCYQHTLNKGLNILYSNTIPFFQKICDKIIDYVDNLVSDTFNIKSVQIDKAFDVGDTLYGMYGNTVPSFAQKGIRILVAKVPFSEFLFEIRDTIRERDKNKASTALFGQVNSYILGFIEEGSLKILYVVFILNLVAQILLLKFL